jgi:hypothetical protein
LRLSVKDLDRVKPTQLPQVKNGEQPGHGFSLAGKLLAVSFLLTATRWQSVSAQHGFTESMMMYTDKSR